MATCFLDCAAVNLRVRGDEHLENVRTPHKPQARALTPQPPPNTPNPAVGSHVKIRFLFMKTYTMRNLTPAQSR